MLLAKEAVLLAKDVVLLAKGALLLAKDAILLAKEPYVPWQFLWVIPTQGVVPKRNHYYLQKIWQDEGISQD